MLKTKFFAEFWKTVTEGKGANAKDVNATVVTEVADGD